VILAAVDADYYELLTVFRFELPQLRENMNAVDSAIGPEIEKNYLPFQGRELELAAPCVNPLEIVRKLRGSHCWLGCELSRH